MIPLVFPIGTCAFRPARYSGWVFVKGSGILDKLSFVDPRPIEPSPPAAPIGPTGAGGPSLVPLWLALAGGMCEL